MGSDHLRQLGGMPAQAAAEEPASITRSRTSELLVARQLHSCASCRYFRDGAMAATASISTMYSGAASLLTSTNVLAGGASALMYCARTERTSSALDMSVT